MITGRKPSPIRRHKVADWKRGTITVIQKRSAATHARLSWRAYGLRIEWGYIKALTFHPVSVEVLELREYPELAELYVGQGWDVAALNHLLTESNDTALPEAVTVLLTQKDINLLASRGIALA